MMLLIFRLDAWKCALDVTAVDRTYRAAAVTPLPEAPSCILGVVNVQGRVLPVVDLRARFQLPAKKLAPASQFVIADTSRRCVVLLVDGVDGVVECDENEFDAAETILPGLEHLKGILRLRDGVVLIQDLAQLLSLDEEAALDKALAP